MRKDGDVESSALRNAIATVVADKNLVMYPMVGLRAHTILVGLVFEVPGAMEELPEA